MKGWCKFFAVQFLSASIMTPQLRREGKKVRQKVLKYPGKKPPTKEQIEILRRER